MKKKYNFAFFMLTFMLTFSAVAQVDVTLRVDMAGVSVNPLGVHVVGTINSWTPDATTLTQEGTTDVYSVTLQLMPGWHRYKFLNGDAWGTEEQATYPCAPSNGDRFLYVNNSGIAVILETVPFNGCNPAGTGFEVTLNVDMSSEGTIAPGNVHVAGWLNDWNPSVLTLPDVSGDIHSGTLRFPTPANYPIELEYKYLSSAGWGNEETPASPATCSTVVGTNRIDTVFNSGDQLYDVFNGCTFTPLSTNDVENQTFKVGYNNSERIINISGEKLSDDNASIEIYNISGQLVTQVGKNDVSDNTIINFNNRSNGIYIVIINSGEVKQVSKLAVY